ncbi:unnamed protein product [Miscanthus lutarioriparius]|uniref:FLZ-type domain-containing protein n=1 Tax=Miscanthus lutarioriparius TaxID=422564 RepID=A0A811QB53_9POAL|nr:unnamed protein product [Miscanthus lutarioriparius]
MVGLGVLEARTTNAQQKQQLLRPTEAPASRTPSPVIRRAYMRHKLHLAPMLVPSIPSWSFLQRCFLCQRELTEGMDIYMYRGDRAFCSESCLCRHMTEDDSSAIDSGRVTAPDRFHRALWQLLQGHPQRLLFSGKAGRMPGCHSTSSAKLPKPDTL